MPRSTFWAPQRALRGGTLRAAELAALRWLGVRWLGVRWLGVRWLGVRWLGVRWLGALAAAGCGGSDSKPLFPASYADSYQEVRACRNSSEHSARVRVLADPAAAGPYLGRDQDFPVGAVVLKEEYDFIDTDCTGPIQAWTVMVRQPAGSHPEALDWAWQKLTASRKVVSEDEPRCINCHYKCGVPPDGYEGTCAVAP